MAGLGGDLEAEKVLRYATDSILITSNDFERPGPTVVYVNAAFEKMTGWTRDEIIGQSPRILQGPNTDFTIFNQMVEILKSGRVWQGQAINYRKDGSEFVMEWSISSIPEEKGEPKYYIAIQRDITRRVEMEQKLEPVSYTHLTLPTKRIV